MVTVLKTGVVTEVIQGDGVERVLVSYTKEKRLEAVYYVPRGVKVATGVSPRKRLSFNEWAEKYF